MVNLKFTEIDKEIDKEFDSFLKEFGCEINKIFSIKDGTKEMLIKISQQPHRHCFLSFPEMFLKYPKSILRRNENNFSDDWKLQRYWTIEEKIKVFNQLPELKKKIKFHLDSLIQRYLPDIAHDEEDDEL